MSYSAGSVKWGDNTLGTTGGTVTWDPTLGAGLTYDTGLYTDADFTDALTAAFQAWEDVADIDFQMVSGTSDIAFGMESLAGDVVAYASYSYLVQSGPDEITDGTITFDSDMTWDPDVSDGLVGLDFYAVALHEIGHVLGLSHVSDTDAIMYPYINGHDLGNGDIAGAQYLYGAADGAELKTDTNEAEAVASSGGGGGGGGGIVLAILGGLLAVLGISAFGAGAAVVAFGKVGDEDDQADGESGSHGDALFDMLSNGEILDETLPGDWHDDEYEDGALELI